MTFCLGVKVQDGLVGIADTRVTSGSECITARKVSVFETGQHSLFLMTSGLRSVRDKVLTYFEDEWDSNQHDFDRTYKAVNALARQLRRVAEEDQEALEASKLSFNLHTLIGGQMEHDKEPRLYCCTRRRTGSKSARAPRIASLAKPATANRSSTAHSNSTTACSLP